MSARAPRFSGRSALLRACSAALCAALATAAAAAAAPAPPLTDLHDPAFWPVGAPMAAAEVVCDIGVSVDEPVELAGFRARVSLRAEPGLPGPSGLAPTCWAVPGVSLDGAAATAAPGLIAVGSVAGAGFAGPGHLFSCSVDLGDVLFLPTTADFDVVTLDAYDPHSTPIAPKPSMSVSEIACHVVGTTTVPGGSTTTTFAEVTTTTMPTDPDVCFVTFAAGPSPMLGSLEFEVDYGEARGALAGEGADVECADLVDADAFTAGAGVRADDPPAGGRADDPPARGRAGTGTAAAREAAVRMSRLAGFVGPADVAVCAFQPDAASRPRLADFAVTAVVATDESGVSVAAPTVVATAVDCPSLSTSTTSTSSTTILELPRLTSSTRAATAHCADLDGDGVSATDALAILQAAVGRRACRLCVCDADGSGTVRATDALVALRTAAGASPRSSCPICPAN